MKSISQKKYLTKPMLLGFIIIGLIAINSVSLYGFVYERIFGEPPGYDASVVEKSSPESPHRHYTGLIWQDPQNPEGI